MAQGALALICTLIYNYVLIDLFKTEVTYIQWFGMIIVSACILPTGRKTKTNKTGRRQKNNNKTGNNNNNNTK